MSIVIPTTEELEKKWDKFSKLFQNSHEPLTIPFCNILISNLNLTSNPNGTIPKSILEIACGAGAGTDLCLFSKHSTTKLTSTDLSNEMINLTRSRLNMNSAEEEDTTRNLRVLKADSENLPFPDSSFDRYFANFCLHLVSDPDRMLRESIRVLEKGGVAAFSVWGRIENCNKFTIISEIAKKLNIQMGSANATSIRTSFHLSDIENLKSMAKNAGFTKVLGGYTICNDLAYCGADFVKSNFSTPDLVEKAKTMDTELLSQWKKQVEDYVDDLHSKGKFITFEAAYIICTK